MKREVTRMLQVSAALLSLALTASAQEYKFRDGRFLETQGGVTIQRADDVSADEAVRNMPFLPGDRVWTDDTGRAEIVFAEGEVLWISERSKVDSLGRENDERLGLRAFAGTFAARVRPRGPGFEFQVQGGFVTTTGPSSFRIDVLRGETVVTVFEGELLADLGGDRRTIRGGERMTYADGRPDGPFRYSGSDAFDRWCEERSRELERMARANDRLPDDLDEYGDELERNGEWVYDEPQGYVYVPRVRYGWAPYTYGRWIYTAYGWTWVDNEPWAFVTSHYGRWGYSPRVGWHWLPRAGFAGAWVAWSSPAGRWNNTIGWCALGFNDRPVGHYGLGGRAVDRTEGRGWTYADRTDMGRANIHRRLVSVPAGDAVQATTWAQGTAPDREFRATRRAAERSPDRPAGRSAAAEVAGAVRRDRAGRGEGDTGAKIYVRPSPGDSTPELRSDPMTTIPTPESRRGKTIGQDGFKEEQDRENRKRGRGGDISGAIEVFESGGQDAGQRRGGSDSSGRGDSAKSDARPESAVPRQERDPLLSRFFRSITQSRDSGDSGSRSDDSARSRGEDSGRSRGEDSARTRGDDSARSRNNPRRDDGSARESSPERSRPPAEARPSGEDRERSRPSGSGSGSGAERSKPRNTPSPGQGSSRGSNDDHGSRRRPGDL